MVTLAPGVTDAATDEADLSPEARLEPFRRELTGYCYRMLGSPYDAEDAVQDTMVRAWRALDKFDGRSSLRSWLYRIATNVCLDQLGSRNKRAMPMDLGEETSPAVARLTRLSPNSWVEPMPDSRVVPTDADPADLAVAKESVRLAFLAALQNLPPKQRAVLILRDVLAWRASEVAALLETTEASVNSALQRARATIAAGDGDGLGDRVDHTGASLGDEERAIFERYVETFEAYDIEALVALLHEDATQAMPPFDLQLRGRADIEAWFRGPGAGCAGSRLVPVEVNGQLGYAQYRDASREDGGTPFSISLVEIEDGKITGLLHFLDPRLFPLFGLPLGSLAGLPTLPDGPYLDGEAQA